MFRKSVASEELDFGSDRATTAFLKYRGSGSTLSLSLSLSDSLFCLSGLFALVAATFSFDRSFAGIRSTVHW